MCTATQGLKLDVKSKVGKILDRLWRRVYTTAKIALDSSKNRSNFDKGWLGFCGSIVSCGLGKRDHFSKSGPNHFFDGSGAILTAVQARLLRALRLVSCDVHLCGDKERGVHVVQQPANVFSFGDVGRDAVKAGLLLLFLFWRFGWWREVRYWSYQRWIRRGRDTGVVAVSRSSTIKPHMRTASNVLSLVSLYKEHGSVW